MAKDSKRKGDLAGAGAKKRASDAGASKIDGKAARVSARRVEKLEQLLTKADRVEHKRVRALDRAHQRRQLIQTELDELRPGSPTTQAAPASAPAKAPVARPAGARRSTTPRAADAARSTTARTAAAKPTATRATATRATAPKAPAAPKAPTATTRRRPAPKVDPEG